MAALTQESIPPLRSTTAFRKSVIFIFERYCSCGQYSVALGLFVRRPWSPGARQICAFATQAAQATRRRESTQPTAAVPALATFLRGRRTPVKTGPGERGLPAHISP